MLDAIRYLKDEKYGNLCNDLSSNNCLKCSVITNLNTVSLYLPVLVMKRFLKQCDIKH